MSNPLPFSKSSHRAFATSTASGRLTLAVVVLLVIAGLIWWRQQPVSPPARPVPPTTTEAAGCAGQFARGVEPRLLNAKLAAGTYPLCFSAFATLFSGIVRTPLYSAEHLTAGRVMAARAMMRVNSFHEEPALPVSVRSELPDYRGSGYDRGHMAPNGDMPDARSQEESFSLANMVPQVHDNNAGIWADIEGTVRDAAVTDGDLYVVTGPLFEGGSLEILHGRVTVPTGLWKAVYDAVSGEAGAYVTDNRPGHDYVALSIVALEQRSGIDPFPALAAAIKAAPPDLPSPRGAFTAGER